MLCACTRSQNSAGKRIANCIQRSADLSGANLTKTRKIRKRLEI